MGAISLNVTEPLVCKDTKEVGSQYTAHGKLL